MENAMLSSMPLTAEYIGSKEACLILDINRSTLTRWVAEGALTPVHKLDGKNGAFLFDRADVEALAEQRASA